LLIGRNKLAPFPVPRSTPPTPSITRSDPSSTVATLDRTCRFFLSVMMTHEPDICFWSCTVFVN